MPTTTITNGGTSYEIRHNEWNGPNQPIGQRATFQLTQVTSAPALPTSFAGTSTINYGGIDHEVTGLTARQATSSITLQWN